MLSINYKRAFVLIWYCQFNLLAQEKIHYIIFHGVRWKFKPKKGMAPGPRVTSNSESQVLAEWNRNNKTSSSEEKTALSTETYRELFDTLAQWNTYLEDHIPYFQKQVQEPSL